MNNLLADLVPYDLELMELYRMSITEYPRKYDRMKYTVDRFCKEFKAFKKIRVYKYLEGRLEHTLITRKTALDYSGYRK